MFWICVTVFFSILLTYCIGFGLGTLLLPVLCLYFPPLQALYVSALLHGFQSAIKTLVNFKHIPWQPVLWFSICAIPASFMGSYCVILLHQWNTNITFYLFTISFHTNPIKIIIALSMLVFSILELLKLKNNSPTNRLVFLKSGALSGFFGGLTGHQGALRSMFTSQYFQTTFSLIAFNGMVSLCIDLTRLVHYVNESTNLSIAPQLILALCGTCLLAISSGQVLLKHLKLVLLNRLIFIFIVLFALCYGSGLV